MTITSQYVKKNDTFYKSCKCETFSYTGKWFQTSQIPVQHIPIGTTFDQIRAMQSIKDAVKSVNFTQGYEYIAIYSLDYVTWASNRVNKILRNSSLSHQSNMSLINQFAQIIGEELIRNLILEIVAVGIVTLVLLRNFLASFWVMCCVLFTLVDLLGSMYFLGLTVEISSTIMILLCAGLAVDYAAHIGLEFIRSSGSKQGR